MHLYELTTEYEAIIQAIQDAEGDVSPDLLAKLDAIGGAFTDKADSIAAVVRTLEATEAAAKTEQDRLAGYRKSLASHADWLKVYLRDQMIRTGNTKVEGPRFRVAVAACPASVDVTDEALVPRDYFEPQPAKLSKAALLKALKEGATVAGARLVTDKKTIRIR